MNVFHLTDQHSHPPYCRSCESHLPAEQRVEYDVTKNQGGECNALHLGMFEWWHKSNKLVNMVPCPICLEHAEIRLAAIALNEANDP